MHFEGFTQNDFDTFTIEGLSERMEAIQERIQPKFRAIGEPLTKDLSMMLDNEMHLHIARHARRKVNPPNDTWLAISNNKRGYKQHPHFQVGLYDDHLFIWLAFIYELPNKQKIATTFIEHLDDILRIVPSHYVVSMDHMKKDKESIAEIDLKSALERFHNVKKAEFLIGRHVASNDLLLKDGQSLYEVAKETFETLLPLYTLSYK